MNSPCCKPSSPPAPIAVTAQLSSADRRGALQCRLSNTFRTKYRVAAGLYTIGTPTHTSPILVSANYRLSFNALRSACAGIDAWILVLDTKGINVWCAAGKGTFSTGEIVARIESTGIANLVSHRTVIVPQLGAPGIQAHEIKKACGFSVLFGPIYAHDLKPFLENGQKASPAMRRVHFTLGDRAVLVPMEVNMAIKQSLVPLCSIVALLGLTPKGILFAQIVSHGVWAIIAFLVALLSGTVLTPLLLPFIPGRAFAFKGGFIGAGSAILFLAMANSASLTSIWLQVALGLAITLLSSYWAFNFTGCTTFTSVAGVKKELKIAIPLYIATAVICALLLGTHVVSQLVG